MKTHNVLASLKSNAWLLLASLFIAILSFPFLTLYYLPGIDGSLPWAFNYLAEGNFQVGKQLLFPHGPFAFLMYPLHVGNNLVVFCSLRIIISMVVSLSIFKIYKHKNASEFILPLIISLLIHAISEIQVLIIAATLLQIFRYQITDKKKHLFFAVFLSVFNLYIKSYGGFICLLSLVAITGEMLVFKRQWRLFGEVIAVYIFFFLSIWLALYHSPFGSVDFLRGQIELASDNSEAVAFYQVNNWYLIFGSLAGFLALPILVRNKQFLNIWLVLAASMFGAWKHAMSRGDNPHVAGFLVFLTLCFLMVWLLVDSNKIIITLVSIVSISFFTLNMATTAKYNDFAPQADIALFRPYNFYRLFDASVVSKKISDSTCYAYNKEEILPDSVKKFIGKSSVDVFPCNQSIIAMNHFKWAPKPSLHSYASYTSWLDKKNAEYYQSDAAAEFIIWQTNILGGQFGSIDQRYLFNDAPTAMLEFLSRYKAVYTDAKVIIFKKRKDVIDYTTVNEVCGMRIDFEKWMVVPNCSKNGLLRLRANISSNFVGKLRSVFYKGISVGIEYEFSDGSKALYKIVPKNAVDGLWVNPFVNNPQNTTAHKTVKRFRFRCWEPELIEKSILFSFESIAYKGSVDFL